MKANNFLLYALAFLSGLTPLMAQSKLIGLSGFGKNDQAYSGGMAWEVNADGSGMNQLKAWNFSRVGTPAQALIAADNGLLWGFTQGFDGAEPALFLQAFNPVTNTRQTLQTIRRTDDDVSNVFSSSNLTAPLFKGNDGYFYACHNLGYKGANIFRISADGQLVEPVYRIDGFVQALPGLSQLPGGQLVAATFQHLYTGSTDGSNWNIIKDFGANNPNQFIAGIVAAPDGWIYGILQEAQNNSKVFKIRPDGSEYTIVTSLSQGVLYDLVLDLNGSLVALMLQNETTVMIQISATGSVNILASFNNDDLPVINNMFQTPDGSFYLTTTTALLLKVSPGGAVQVLSTLPSTYGLFGWRLAFQSGKLYGWEEGQMSQPNQYRGISGAIFELKLDGSNFQYLEEIDRAPSEGAFPTLLIKASDGAYYGAMSAGGAQQSGLVFRLEADGSGYTPIYQTPELAKVTRLQEAGNGRIIGSMTQNNASGLITGSRIVSFAMDGSDVAELANFSSYTEPAASFVVGTDEKIYWMRGNHLMRMDTDGANKTDLGARPEPGSNTFGYVGQLQVGQEGLLFGYLDFDYELPGLESGRGRILFTLDVNNALLAQITVAEDFLDFVQVKDGSFYSRNYHYSDETFSYSVNQDVDCLYTPHISGSNNWLYGTTVNPYNNTTGDLRAYQVVTGDCRQVIPSAALGYQSKFCFETAGTTAVASPQSNSALLLSPNPAQSTLHLELNTAVGDKSWTIYSMTGTIVGQGRCSESAWFVDIAAFPPATYIVRVLDTNGRIWHQKMIKQ